tara:strand:+ start:856 stop:1164 length:309 start_codon:yes stop_codon:yes gene_type:complete
MLDIGFIGNVAAGGVLPLALQCRDASLRSIEPTGTPSYVIFKTDGSTIATGTMSIDPSGYLGFRMDSLSVGNSYEPGVLYTVRFDYKVDGVDRSCVGSFMVV